MRASNTSLRNNSNQTSKRDYLLWFIVFLIVAAGIVANFYYSDAPWALRAAAGIIVGAIALAVASQTQKGQQAWEFIKGARVELRKVVWPTRQETVQTTLVVVAMVLIMAIFLWGLDSLLLWGITWFTGNRG